MYAKYTKIRKSKTHCYWSFSLNFKVEIQALAFVMFRCPEKGRGGYRKNLGGLDFILLGAVFEPFTKFLTRAKTVSDTEFIDL